MEWQGVESETAEMDLREREEAFNVKIVLECECGHVVGYFDVNRNNYVLTNLI